MALINNIGKSHNVTYGTRATLNFQVRFMTFDDNNVTTLNTQQSLTPTNLPSPGDIIVAGTRITLSSADVLSPAHVVRKIVSNGVQGMKVGIDTYNPFIVNLQSIYAGPINILDPWAFIPFGSTATNIMFFDFIFTQGTPMTGLSPADDIYIGGRIPVSLGLAYANCSATILAAPVGTQLEQQLGTLNYGSPITFTGGVVGQVPVQSITFSGTTTAGGTIITVDGIPVTVPNGLTPTQVAQAVAEYIAPDAVSTLGTFNNNSTTITVTSATGIGYGMVVSGIGITPGTVVTNISGTTLTISSPTLSNGTSTNLLFSTIATSSGQVWNATTGGTATVTLTGLSYAATPAITVSMGTVTGVTGPSAATVVTAGIAMVPGTATITTPVSYLRVSTTGTSALSEVNLYITI